MLGFTLGGGRSMGFDATTRIHHYGTTQNCSTALKILSALLTFEIFPTIWSHRDFLEW